MDARSLIDEQIEYYSNRAAEYDATSRPPGGGLDQFGTELIAALDRFGPTGNVLEIACGTGGWTAHLLRHATAVTALDASGEMIELARAKIEGDPRVRFVRADVFSWVPDRQYDVVLFANWLSHVPFGAFDAFWRTVGDALRPGGRVFIADELEDAWRYEPLREEFVGDSTTIAQRTLRNGRTFRVVKVFWRPERLGDRLRALGWEIDIQPVGPFFWADAHRAA